MLSHTNDVREVSAPGYSLVERRLILKEIRTLLKLTFPIFISMVSWVGMKVTDTAVLGHVGTKYLDATALSDLWTSSFGVFIQSRILGTFCSQAYGAGNKQLVGIMLQVAYFVLFSVMVVVAICWLLTGVVLRSLGRTEQEYTDAGYYANVLALCLPARIAFSQLNCFFSAQKIMRPGVVCSVVAMLLNLVGSLVLVLGIGIPGWNGFGFIACPWVTTIVEFVQIGIAWFVFCHCQQLHRECWPGWSVEHLTRERVVRFWKMYFPAALAIGSDFWRVAVIGAVASQMGQADLSVFNAGYRVCWMCMTFMGALAGAVSIKLGIALGAGSVADAKLSAAVGTGLAVTILFLLGLIVVCIPRQLGQIFSDDVEVIDRFETCSWPFAAFVILMNLSINLERIPMAAGRVNAVFYAGLVGSWAGQVPGVIICTRFWRNDLVGLYTGVASGYGLLVLLYTIIVLRIKWEDVLAEAQLRSEKTQPSELTTSLQPRPTRGNA